MEQKRESKAKSGAIQQPLPVPPTPMQLAFLHQNVFMTGVTGLVGKVLLFKILKDLPQVDSVFVLIRTKKNVSPAQRAEALLSSPCFDPLKNSLSPEEWKKRVAKVVVVPGDILQDQLGMSEADYARVSAATNIIFHLAATVEFNAPLDYSVRMNVLGTLRVFALGRKCPQLRAFCHTSTCYVNWARFGADSTVGEQLYPLAFDAEGMCKHVLGLDRSLVAAEGQRILEKYDFPNTYTFTKSITEHILMKQKGTVPLIIVRPAIIGAAWKEPFPGWVDSLTAAGGIILTGGLGVLRELYLPKNNIADIVPLDFVVNTLLKAAAARSVQSQPAPAAENAAPGPAGPQATSVVPTVPDIVQACTSSTQNVCSWEMFRIAGIKYWSDNPHSKQLHRADLKFYENKKLYAINWFLRRQVHAAVLKTMASMPYIGSEEKLKLAKKYERAVFRSGDLQKQFEPFTSHEWHFEDKNAQSLNLVLSQDEKKCFSSDPYDISWYSYVQAYSYGLIKYVMKSADGRPEPAALDSPNHVFTRACL